MSGTAAVGRGERTIPTLDGWRAVAVVAVILSHGVPLGTPLQYLRVFGVHGVFIFFGISGYLITTKLLEEERRGGIDLRTFYLRRVFRILPPAFAFLGLVAVGGAVGLLQAMPWRELTTSAFFLQNYTPLFEGRTPYTLHFWSLAVEEHFYFIWPFLLAALGSRRARKVVPLIAFAIAGWRLWDSQAHLLFSSMPDNWNANRTDRVLDGLLWGCYLAMVLVEPKVRLFLQGLLRPAVWWGLAAAYVVNIGLHTRWMTSVEVLLVPLLLAGTVLRPGDRVGRVLDSAPLRWVGQLSYSLYLWQMLFFVASFRAPQWPQLFPLNALFTVALAWASYRFVEQPCIAFGRRLLAARRERQTVLAAARLSQPASAPEQVPAAVALHRSLGAELRTGNPFVEGEQGAGALFEELGASGRPDRAVQPTAEGRAAGGRNRLVSNALLQAKPLFEGVAANAGQVEVLEEVPDRSEEPPEAPGRVPAEIVEHPS